MRIAFLTQEDPLYIAPFFESFFAALPPSVEVGAVYACRAMGRRKRIRLLGELLRLYRPAGLLKLLALRLAARSSMPALAASRGIPYRRVGDPNDPAIVGELARLGPDVLVSVACPYILKPAVLAIPRLTSINIHHAPLPRYKGMMPTFWQMFHGERSVGVSVHVINERLDDGAVLLRDSMPIREGETLHQLIRRSKQAGAEAVLRVLRQLEEGTAAPMPPLPVEPTSFTFPSAAEIADFHRRSLRAI